MSRMMLQLAVVFVFNLLIITGQARLSIINVSTFPHPVDTKFQLQVVPTNRLERIDQLITNTMIIQIKDNNRKKNQKYIFDYGSRYKIDDIIDNDFITIEEWTKNQDSTLIQISILFKRISNGHIIQIFDLQARSFKIRKDMINNLTLATRLYNETIELVSPSKLQLTVNSTGGENVDLVRGQLAMAKCRSYDGIPVETPNFTNLQYFDVINKSFVKENNEIKIMFRVQLMNHRRHLNCSAGQTQISMMIRVLHPTTKIIIEPQVNKTLEINSSISCYSKDGYPQAQTQWHLIEGPTNASSFYKIMNEGKTLHIREDVPIEALWRFNCSIIGDVIINETISFMTTDKYCDNFCLSSQISKMKQTQRKYFDQIKIQNRQILQIEDQINNYIEILKENQSKQNSQIYKSIEILKKTSTNQMKILQESIANITKKYDSIGQQNKQEIDDINNNLRDNIIGVPDLLWKIDGISDLMKKYNNIYSFEGFYPGNKIYKIYLNIIFHQDKLQMFIDSKPNNSKAIYPVKMEATVAIINMTSPQYYKVIKKSFVLERAFISRTYLKHDVSELQKGTHSPFLTFTKQELAPMITGDSITIKCFIKFK